MNIKNSKTRIVFLAIAFILIILTGLFAFSRLKRDSIHAQSKNELKSKKTSKRRQISQKKSKPSPISPNGINRPSNSHSFKRVQTQPGKINCIRSYDPKLADWKGEFNAGIRSRAVKLDPQILNNSVLKENAELSFQLFDDVKVDAVVTKSLKNVNGTISSTAKVKDSKWGRVFIAYTDGELHARIRVPEENKLYAIEFNHETGMHYALELDITLAEPPEGLNDAIRPPDADQAADSAQELPPPVMTGDEAVDTSYVIDVMVVYTDDALTAAGSQAAMDNNIAIGIAFANDAHANTETMITLNLVYSYEENYTETGSNANDLDRLTFSSTYDPWGRESALGAYMLDDVHTYRDTYGADFTIMMNATGSGGLAWSLTQNTGRPDLAFCVIDDNNFLSYTPGHEIGHNMGLSHAYDQDYQWGPTGGDFGNYSAGWHWHPTPGQNGYCTVMTYTDGSYFDGVPPSGAPTPPAHACTDGLGHVRVGLFSDPDYTDHGMATGNATNGDNARVLKSMQSVYEAYRTRNIGTNVILVEYPNGGETLTADSTCNIKWNSDGVTGNVKIELLQNGSLDRVIAADTLNDRNYSWTVPSDVGGIGYTIRISNLADTITDSSDAVFSVQKIFYNEPLDTNPGYTTTGAWSFGISTGDNPTYGGPTDAYSGTNIYDTNLSGAAFSTCYLTSVAIDCSNYQNVYLDFMGWFSVYTGYEAKVQVSNNGSNWTDLYSTSDTYSSSWVPHSYDISSIADGQSTVYIRWGHIRTAGGSNYSGLSVDDITIRGIPCHTLTVTDGTGSGSYVAGTTVNISATIPTNYHFVNWTGDVANVADVNNPTTTITMSSSAVTITANFAGGDAPHSADTNNDWKISLSEVNSFITAYNNNNNTVSTASGDIIPGRITMRELLRVIYLYNNGGDYIGGQATVDTYDVNEVAADAETPLSPLNNIITVTNSADSGAGSLRNAIANASYGDTITFDESLDTVILASEIVIDKSITIDGNGIIIVNGNSKTRIFQVYNEDEDLFVTILNLGIVDANNSSDKFGGAIYNNGENLTLKNCLLNNNTNSFAGGQGGAIYSSGSLTVNNCIFTDNSAEEEDDIYSINGEVVIE